MEDWKQRLKQSRENNELNKTEFARAVGVSNATVTDWEKGVGEGGIKELSGSSLVKIHEVLGIDLYWLLSGKGASHPAALPSTAHQPANEDAARLSLVAPELTIETSTPDMLQWVSLTEAKLLTEFRCLGDAEQIIVLDSARSLPHLRQAQPRSDQS